MGLSYKIAEKCDASALIGIYNAAFYDDYVRYGECPAYGRTLENMERSIENFPKIMLLMDKNPVWVISFENRGSGDYYIGCLCVIPEFQGRGIGTRAVRHMLSVCSDWKKVSLKTPADKEQNIRFYMDKCGFSPCGTELDGGVAVVNLLRER